MIHLDYYTGQDHYSEGGVEDELLQIVKSGEPVEEVLRRDNRWSLMYHLSPQRQDLLNWYPFKPGSKILEVGAGLGAITGALCEQAEKVVAIELSKRRSEINWERNSDYQNLEIFVGNAMDMSFEEKFDAITLVGVLEYAASFTRGEDPAVKLLTHLRQFLAPGGVIAVAIENRYGLKYWAGVPEDHTGLSYDGIEGYTKSGQKGKVTTYGLEEIKRVFERAGFPCYDFYYPYPDYKLPVAIWSDRCLPTPDLHFGVVPNYAVDRLVTFNETVAWRGIIENNQFPFFSNSFLCFISEEGPGETTRETLLC